MLSAATPGKIVGMSILPVSHLQGRQGSAQQASKDASFRDDLLRGVCRSFVPIAEAPASLLVEH